MDEVRMRDDSTRRCLMLHVKHGGTCCAYLYESTDLEESSSEAEAVRRSFVWYG